MTLIDFIKVNRIVTSASESTLSASQGNPFDKQTKTKTSDIPIEAGI
jgi:hypothetical protein